jgi:rhodanese-related sulfurtransferase
MKTSVLNAPEQAEEFFADKLAFTIGPVEVNQQIEDHEKNLIIDVRDTKDFLKGHVPGAINLPEGQWEKTSNWLNDQPLIVYCYSQTCHLAARAAVEFARQGHSVQEMEGGFDTWKENKLPVEK